MTIRVVPEIEFAVLLLVTDLLRGTPKATSYCKRPSAATEGGPQFTRLGKERSDAIPWKRTIQVKAGGSA